MRGLGEGSLSSGRNINGYFGERIDIGAVLSDGIAAARAHGWSIEEISACPKPNLLALTRLSRISSTLRSTATEDGHHESREIAHPPRIYISAGIHGDEPAGPMVVTQLLQEDCWPPNVSLWVCPCLNPTGFMLNRRENAEGIDLNRQYLRPKAEETLAHIEWLKRQPSFDLCLCLHEDWEARGFYVYELNPENRPSVAEVIVARVAQVCPIDRSEIIEGRPARDGIIRPSVDPRSRPQWPESFFLLTHKTRLSYTLEAPSDFPLTARVAALIVGVQAATEDINGRR